VSDDEQMPEKALQAQSAALNQAISILQDVARKLRG
jgi:hypothetical protein